MATKKREVTKEQLLRPLSDHITEETRRPYRKRRQRDDRLFCEGDLNTLGKEPDHDDTKN